MIYELHCKAQHAYMTILQAVKTGQPHFNEQIYVNGQQTTVNRLRPYNTTQ